MIDIFLGMAILGGVTSQSLLDAGMVLIFLHFLYQLFRKKVSFSTFKWLGIEWAFLGYFLIAVISLFINGLPPVPWAFYLTKFNWIFNLYLTIYAFNQSKFNIQNWLKFFCIAFLIPNLYALFTYHLQYDFFTETATTAIIGFVHSATYHAHGSSLIFVFFATLMLVKFQTFSRSLKIASLFCLGLMGASIFLTFTRGIWGATFISLLTLFVLYNKKSALYFLGVTLPALGLSLLLSSQIQSRLLNSFNSHSDQVRSNLLKVHWLMFTDHPWIGIGFWESYRQIANYWPRLGLPATYMESHAHNQYLNVLATTGIIGFLFFTAIFIFFIYNAASLLKKVSKNTTDYALVLACLITLTQFLTACLTDITFEYAKIRGILTVVLGLLSFMILKYKEKKHE